VRLEDSDPDDWWRAYEVNVRGNYNLVRAILRVAAPDGRIVHVSTMLATLPRQFGYSAYASSKLASTKMFEYVQHEHPNLQLVSYHLGVIWGTKMDDKIIESKILSPYDERKSSYFPNPQTSALVGASRSPC
jgi:NAD(P)-dependent dehydrogenase (short-subunit alcohol dehydrogenase family)